MTSSPFMDQMQAASDHAETIVNAGAAATGLTPVRSAGIGGPVGVLLWEWAAHSMATIRTCKHITGMQPVFGYLPLMGCVHCAQCGTGPARKHYARTVAADECDACRRTGVQTFTELTLNLGPLILSANVCTACKDAM